MKDLKNKSIETQSVHGNYDPLTCEGAVKMPIFQSSTFKFKNCSDGEAFFAGKRKGFIYSRLGNPNLAEYEYRMANIDGNEAGLVFNSGMSAITSMIFGLCKPGDGIIYFSPIYGGTHTCLANFFPTLKIITESIEINENLGKNLKNHILNENYKTLIKLSNLKLILFETPSNPSLNIVDIEEICKIVKEFNNLKKQTFQKLGKDFTENDKIIVAVDNTFYGPVFQKPKQLGADIVIYSATKFLCGSSDVVAGVLTSNQDIINKIKPIRANFGTNATPFSCFLLLRSLETVSLRMKAQSDNAIKFFKFLEKFKNDNPKIIKKIFYPLAFEKDSIQYKIWKKQSSGTGSMISFDVYTQENAFKIINQLKIVTLAVSLGSTESLCQHPYSMTHQKVDEKIKKLSGITKGLIRLSIGLEDPNDVIQDFKNAFKVLE